MWLSANQAEPPQQARELRHGLHLMVWDLLLGAWPVPRVPPGPKEHAFQPEQLCRDDVGIDSIPDHKAATGGDLEGRNCREEDLGIWLP